MKYLLTTALKDVKGIGSISAQSLEKKGFSLVKDLLLFTPLRCEDRSLRKKIDQLIPGELVTLEAKLNSSSQFFRGRRSIQRAVVSDDTGKLTLMWFNTPYVLKMLQKDQLYLISGALNEKKSMIHPTIESSSSDTIHTDRLVPIYSSVQGLKIGSLRRTLKHILDNLEVPENVLSTFKQKNKSQLSSLANALSQLHFPDSDLKLIEARERIALEELISLIQRSHQIKNQWSKSSHSLSIPTLKYLPPLPFELTAAQDKSLKEIACDLQSSTPMNRLLVGDVGSGKTIVAGLAMLSVLKSGHSACLIAPTKILAQQHLDSFNKFFPDLPVCLVTSLTTLKTKKVKKTTSAGACLYIGTHSLINRLTSIAPALIVYDEQHRFGVVSRSAAYSLQQFPHLLTLTATPIPRTLMLTIFSHLSLSLIDELPKGRVPVKTWVVTKQKKDQALNWVGEQLLQGQTAIRRPLCIVVCPFIDTSESEGLDHVASVTDTFELLSSKFSKNFKLEKLHSRLSASTQAEVIARLYEQKIDILVTTPIVEVGVDLPAADIMIIENAERFGLASLHQLRGRVGRAKTQAFCLLFSSTTSTDVRHRLDQFTQIQDGQKLAELDLSRRGAGDIFGASQHGFDSLQFASWTNLELITRAKQLTLELEASHTPYFSPLFVNFVENDVPLAN